MKKSNNDLRQAAQTANIPLWAIADQLGISDQKLFRDWRRELSAEDKQRIRKIIDELKGETP